MAEDASKQVFVSYHEMLLSKRLGCRPRGLAEEGLQIVYLSLDWASFLSVNYAPLTSDRTDLHQHLCSLKSVSSLML